MPLESVSGGGVAVELALGGTLLPGLVVAGQLTSQMITSTSVSYGGVPVDSYREARIKYTTAGLLLEYYPDDSKGFSSGVAFGQMSGAPGAGRVRSRHASPSPTTRRSTAATAAPSAADSASICRRATSTAGRAASRARGA